MTAIRDEGTSRRDALRSFNHGFDLTAGHGQGRAGLNEEQRIARNVYDLVIAGLYKRPWGTAIQEAENAERNCRALFRGAAGTAADDPDPGVVDE
jgi:hypothetical protein